MPLLSADLRPAWSPSSSAASSPRARPAEVLEHPRVIESYLGTDESAINRSGRAGARRASPDQDLVGVGAGTRPRRQRQRRTATAHVPRTTGAAQGPLRQVTDERDRSAAAGRGAAPDALGELLGERTSPMRGDRHDDASRGGT